MLRSILQRKTFIFALLCVLGQSASAGDAVDLNRFRASPDSAGGFVVGDPRRLANGESVLSLALDGASGPAVLRRVDGTSAAIVGFRMGASLGGVWGLRKGWSIAADLPVVLGQSGSFGALPALARPGDGTLTHVAFGDLRVTPRWSVMSQSRGPVDLRVEAGFVLPTGSASALASDGAFGAHAGALVGRRLGAFDLLGEAGARLRPDRTLLRVDFGSEVFVRAAARHALPEMLGLKPWAVVELDFATPLVTPLASVVTSPIEWRVGARACVRQRWVVTVADGAGLTGAYGSPTNRFIVGVGQDPRVCPGRSDESVLEPLPPKDADGDGVPDPEDRCPQLVGLAEHQGCPPPVVVADTDADGVPDADDQCPREPGVPAFHGCNIDAADRDRDGLSDDLDDCPDEPGTNASRGCAIVDRDKDGIADDEDLCPSEVGPSERNGCPVHDRDRDGVEDDQDRCAAVAGDARSLGCVFVDRDGDGVADVVDNCPDVAGEVENAGCGTRQVVAIRVDRLELLEAVKFVGESAALEPKSLRVLDQIAALLKTHLELMHVRVEAHVDNVGNVASAKRLTELRANTVVRYLRAKGIESSRLEAAGLGGENPVASNATVRGKEANRRIEVRLLRRAKAGDPLDTTSP